MNLTWTSHGQQFRFQAGDLVCEVDPAQPHAGARVTRASEPASELVSAFAQPSLSHNPLIQEDCFARQTDLCLRYAASKDLPTSVSVVWRLQDPAEWLSYNTTGSQPPALLLECVISFQTDLLDAAPVQEVLSRFPAGALLPVPPLRPAHPGEIDWPRSENANLIAAEGRLFLSTVYPSDLRWLATSRDGKHYSQQIRLRAENLEKGVIRRLRCLLAVGPESLRNEFEQLPDRFADSKLPLSV
ncbi:MAG: hypothetical protein ACKO0N_16190 [Planctomycetota bacterium]